MVNKAFLDYTFDRKEVVKVMIIDELEKFPKEREYESYLPKVGSTCTKGSY